MSNIYTFIDSSEMWSLMVNSCIQTIFYLNAWIYWQIKEYPEYWIACWAEYCSHWLAFHLLSVIYTTNSLKICFLHFRERFYIIIISFAKKIILLKACFQITLNCKASPTRLSLQSYKVQEFFVSIMTLISIHNVK